VITGFAWLLLILNEGLLEIVIAGFKQNYHILQPYYHRFVSHQLFYLRSLFWKCFDVCKNIFAISLVSLSAVLNVAKLGPFYLFIIVLSS